MTEGTKIITKKRCGFDTGCTFKCTYEDDKMLGIDIFDVDGYEEIGLRGGSHIYRKFDNETGKERYIYISEDGCSKRVINKELFGFLYEEQVERIEEDHIIYRKV